MELNYYIGIILLSGNSIIIMEYIAEFFIITVCTITKTCLQ